MCIDAMLRKFSLPLTYYSVETCSDAAMKLGATRSVPGGGLEFDPRSGRCRSEALISLRSPGWVETNAGPNKFSDAECLPANGSCKRSVRGVMCVKRGFSCLLAARGVPWRAWVAGAPGWTAFSCVGGTAVKSLSSTVSKVESSLVFIDNQGTCRSRVRRVSGLQAAFYHTHVICIMRRRTMIGR